MVTLTTGFYNAPFGKCLIAFSEKGIVALFFEEDEQKAMTDLQRRFKNAVFQTDFKKAEDWGKMIFEQKARIPLDLQGTAFQKKVWSALLQIPVGTTVTYRQVASLAGNPDAIRATGTAIGANPVAWFIPCHRVIRSDGKPGGYRWGLPLKKQMLIAEGVGCNW